MRPLKLSSLAAILTIALSHACAEPECPHGFYKIDSTCLRIDGGKAMTSSEAGVNAVDDETEDDAGTNNAPMDAATGVDSAMSNGVDGGPAAASDAAMTSDATSTPTTDAGGNPAPAPECDATHPCGAGLVCSAMKCVSACTQTQCDPNATCSLIANAPVCTCNRGFIAMTGGGGAVTCLRDVACEELGCDVNAGCQIIDQLRTCVCKNGYTGTGKVCTPVSCPMPTLENGTATASGGVTFDSTATYQCNSGYNFSSGGPTITRKCGADRSWGAAVPSCAPRNCGSLTIAYGTADTSRGTTYGSPAATFSCQSGFVRSGPATADCQANGTWTAAPKCLGCGDQEVSNIPGLLQEQCDPTATGWNSWTCTTTCQKHTIYTRCSGNSGTTNGVPQGIECQPGQTCAGNTCTQACTSSNLCPATPSSTRTAGKCGPDIGTSTAICFASGCLTAFDCAPGLSCISNTSGNTACLGT